MSEPFVDTLPASLATAVLWSATVEDDPFSEWAGDGGGAVLLTDDGGVAEAAATPLAAHSGNQGLHATVSGAWHGMGGDPGVAFARWSVGDGSGALVPFPDQAFYSLWMMAPEAYDPGVEEWAIVSFQSRDSLGEGTQAPLRLTLEAGDDGGLVLALRHDGVAEDGAPSHTLYRQADPQVMEAGAWVHIETLVDLGDPSQDGDARVAVWQDGTLVLDLADLALDAGDDGLVWSLGSTASHIDGGIEPGRATLYFDDAIVATQPIHTALTPGADDGGFSAEDGGGAGADADGETNAEGGAGDPWVAPDAVVRGSARDDTLVICDSAVYRGGSGRDTYLLTAEALDAGETAVVVDRSAGTRIQIPEDTQVLEADASASTLDLIFPNQARVILIGANAMTFVVEGGGGLGPQQSYDAFLEATFGDTPAWQGQGTAGPAILGGATAHQGTAGADPIPTGFAPFWDAWG